MNILGSPDTHRCTELDLKNSNTSIHSVNWGSFSWKLCTMRSLRRLFPLILLANVRAARRGVPHPHQGKLKPFEPGPPSVKLSGADQAKVDGGELVMRQTVIDGGSSGRATAIQAVHAPPRLVWKQLLDLNAYPSKVEKLTECSKYFEKARGVDGSKTIKARFLVKAAPGFSFEYYCDHIYSPQKKSLTVSSS